MLEGMELTDSNISTLSEYLKHTLNPDVGVRRPAEKFLESVEVNKNYPLLLLYLVDNSEIDLTIRVAGSVAFKNYVKRNWGVEEGSTDRIHGDDRNAIKTLIVDMMLKSPELVQKQLSDAVSTIGSYDFPWKWPGLIDQMIEKFSSGDFHIINGVLQTAHSLFKKYRHQFKSQTLWEEIKFVLDKFAKPLTDLLNATMNLAGGLKEVEALKVISSSLTMICKVFYSLNFQDLPEFFEDNMETWMTHFLTLLSFDVKELHTMDDDEAGILERLKGQICDNISLYAQKYDEEFSNYMPVFFSAVKSLLISSGQQPKYDNLVSNALGFMANVADRKHYSLYQDPVILNEICNNVIIPNLEFRASDEELFEDNAEEYIRRDIEGSDVDTRRRAACDLVKALAKRFEQNMMSIFGQYVEAMLSQYSSNPAQNWKSKDAACFLVTSLASRGQTERHGVTQTSELVNLSDFANFHIFIELSQQDVNAFPVVKADAIKYIMVFRSVLPKKIVVSCLPDLVRFLLSTSPVVHTYAAAAIEKILALKAADHSNLILKEEVAPVAGDLLVNLFRVLDTPVSHENEYVMKGIMRSFVILQTAIIPYLGELLPKLTQKLSVISRNPSKPHFNHYLFETLALSIKIVCSQTPEAVSSFEQALFPTFEGILQQDVQEFIPYVFQLLSMLLELLVNKVDRMPDAYFAVIPCLLAPVLWERSGNVKPLVRLLQAAIVLSPRQIVEENLLNGILGVFQKLIASKVNSHEGFALMEHLIHFLPQEAMKPYVKQVFVLIFTRLQTSKTAKFIKSVIRFLSFYITRYSPLELIDLIDSIQAGMFGMVLERIVIPDIRKISGVTDKKIAAVGVTKILCECEPIFNGSYSKYWSPLLNSLVGLFEIPEDQLIQLEDKSANVEDNLEYSPAYSQLAHAQKPAFDPFVEVTDPRLFLAQNLGKLSLRAPGRVLPLIGTLGDAEKSFLTQYLAAANMLTYKVIFNSLLKLKAPLRVGSTACYSDGGFHDERIHIGKREWVGYGVISPPNYVDRVDFPMPAVRFQEIKGDLIALKEKEKGDWRKLSLEEKKKLYRASFCQTFSEVYAPTGQWKSILGWSFVLTSIGLVIFILQKVFITNEWPETFNEEKRQQILRRMLVSQYGYATGVAAKWDYEKDDWK
ncbi:hypothetical protein RUM44_002341 [Polyplax serrata]|uniref:Exportin-2 n=1 Tax=Polyplax serrata TaxID=468196 RepID=A0ABR1AMN3_POLSC